MTKEKEYLLNLAREKAEEFLDDDFTYPQLYFERIAKRNEQMIADFADDFSTSTFWDGVLEEAWHDGVPFSRADLHDIAQEVAEEWYFQWERLSREERAKIFPK